MALSYGSFFVCQSYQRAMKGDIMYSRYSRRSSYGRRTAYGRPTRYGRTAARRPAYGARAGFMRRGPMRRRFTVGGSRW